MQYLPDDSSCLHANVIRIFDYVTEENREIDIQVITTKPVACYGHVILKEGIKLGAWSKIGHILLEATLELPTFRLTNEVGLEKSYDWFIWKVGEDHITIGELTDKYRHLDIGTVVHPLELRDKVITGKDGFTYPE